MTVCVHPRASRNQVGTTIGSLDRQVHETISIRLTASPVRGAANAACRTLLADLLRIAKSRILIVQGETSRTKLLRVRDTDIASVLARLKSSK
jgi:uncharacterized protein YggU (UPF0235/DUF167 family)